MKKLVIIGAGGFGREVAALVVRINKVQEEWEFVGFLDDADNLQNQKVAGFRILGGVDWLKTHKQNVYVVCAIGKTIVRKEIIRKCEMYSAKFATLIDPDAIIFSGSVIGEGSIICANSVLTVNVEVGKHVIINLNCTVGHDSVIEDFCTINPGVNISGKVIVGNHSDLGTGTKVIQGKTINQNVILGAGSVVVQDLTEEGTYVGIPAKRIKLPV